MNSFHVQTRAEPDSCLVSKQDLKTLLERQRTEPELAHRNLFVGIAISSALGCAGILASHLDELFTVGINLFESFFLVILISSTLAASVLAAFFHHRCREADDNAEHRALHWHLREQIDRPVDPEDPRQWP